MRGTIAKKGNRYYPVVDLGKNPVTGKRKRKWHSGHDRKRDAQQALNPILGQIQSGEYVERTKKTFGEFLSDWLDTRQESIEPTTHNNYGHQLSYVHEHLGSRRLQDITPMELTAFYADLLEGGRKHHSGGLSPKSVRNVHGVIRKALGDAVRWNLITRNPAVHAELPKMRRREMTTWSPTEVAAFLDSERGQREHAIWVLAATTGMRRGEVLGLSWDAISSDYSSLSVTQTLVNVGNTPTLKTEP